MMEQTPLPVISSRQLSAEAAARLKQFKEYAILHPQLARVDRQLSRAIEEPAGFAYVLLYGPSGVGKTTLIRQLEQRSHSLGPLPQVEYTGGTGSHLQLPPVPLLLVTARPLDLSTFNPSDYY